MFFNPSAFAVKTVKEIKCIVVIVDFFEMEYHNANERWNSHGVNKKKKQTNLTQTRERERERERESWTPISGNSFEKKFVFAPHLVRHYLWNKL